MTTNSSSCMLLPSSLQIRGGPVGKGGHNSDEALLAAGSYQVTRRPTRPPLDEQSGDEPPGTDRSRQRHQRSVAWQVRPQAGQAGPPPPRIFTVAWKAAARRVSGSSKKDPVVRRPRRPGAGCKDRLVLEIETEEFG